MHKTKKISALPALIAVLALIVCALVVGVFADGGEAEEAVSRFYGTAWSLLSPVIAIVLALITKEVYSSLFVGILAGGLLYSNFAFEGTVLAHTDGGAPSMVLHMEEATEFELGYLIYFFEKACAVSGYLMGVNPFDQPGVESYKKNMFALLGKAGYENEKAALEARLAK